MVSTIHIDLKGGEFHFMTGSASLEERLCEPRGAPPEADLGLRSSICVLLFALSGALLKCSARTSAECASSLVHVTKRSLSLLSNKCIFERAFKTGRRNYDVWASFFSADSRKIGKVMVKVVPESTLLLT